MPKSSTKSRSKRVTLKTKHKILRKVREHNRKKNKELKAKAGQKQKKKKLMAPSIPSDWPFKEQVMKEYEEEKAKEVQMLEAAKEERKLRKAENKRKFAESMSINSIQQQAKFKEQEYEAKLKEKKRETDPSDPDGSRRAFYREFSKVVKAADVVLHVLDARDPLGCRCLDVERYIVKSNPNKKIILLLNKIDLVPKEAVQGWLKYLREEMPTVAFKCATQQKGAIGHSKSKDETASGGSGECLGAETLLQLLKNYSRSQSLKTAITVGVVGLPNVGKSSLINSLLRTRAVNVGSTPGLTRHAQEVHLDKHVKLLDSPGVVFAQSGEDQSPVAAALRSACKLEKLPDPITPVVEIVRRCAAKKLMEIYKIPRFTTAQEFLQHIATSRGKLKKGGVVDLEAAARAVLQDWSLNRIPHFTRAPAREGKGGAELVQSWGKEFNADQVFANERSTVIEGLPSTNDSMFIETESAGEASMDLQNLARYEEREDDEGGMEDMDDDQAGSEDDDEQLERPSKASRSKVDLYTEEGQFDPRSAKQQKKNKKKGISTLPEVDNDADYDFSTDFKPSFGQLVEEDEEDEEEEDDDEEDEDEEDEDEDEDAMEG